MHKAGAWWLLSTNEAPHVLFLGATTQQDTVVFTPGAKVCGDSQVIGGGLAKVPHFWLLRGKVGPPEIHLCPHVSLLSLYGTSTQATQVIDWICYEPDIKLFNTVQPPFAQWPYLHGEIPGCPRWEPGHHLRSWQKCCHSLGSLTSHTPHLHEQTHLRSHCWETESRERHTGTHIHTKVVQS